MTTMMRITITTTMATMSAKRPNVGVPMCRGIDQKIAVNNIDKNKSDKCLALNHPVREWRGSRIELRHPKFRW